MAFLFIAIPRAKAQTNAVADSIKIYQLLDAADEEAVTGSLDKALQHANAALQLSRTKKMLRGEGFARLKQADIIIQQSNTGKIDQHIEDALKIANQLKDSFMLALAFYQHGQAFLFNGQYTEAEKLFHKSLAIHFEKNVSGYTGLVYNDMGYMFGILGEFENKRCGY
ncbi:hypothetical protein [Paraflavitalea speifideaquila]|uniref:hypothetical protein n=1 Tax=Paraflavitalea speifideaquila TaxID=3076558 RepID=UPI0028E98F68|nr:hypothetical protein [Paraflavitalea speifideiaquila]